MFNGERKGEKMIIKHCKRCKKDKSLLDDFYYEKRAKDKRTSNCKKCMRERSQIRNMNLDPEVKKAKTISNKLYMRKYTKIPFNREKKRIRDRNYHSLVRMIKNFDSVKDDTIKNLHGIGKQGYKDHLESLFEPGMSWKNYGAWQLDHKINLSEFNLLNPDIAKVANYYKNIRPMWATGEKGNLTRSKTRRIH